MFIETVDWSFLYDRNKPSLSDQFSEWLYGPWSEEKYNEYLKLNMISPIHDYMEYLFDKRDAEHYLDRYYMTYSDIKDPRKLHITNSATRLGGSILRSVSRNIDKLY